MSRYPRIGPSQPSDLSNYTYDPVRMDSHEDCHEMLNIETLSSRVLDPDAVSDRSGAAPLLKTRDMRDPDAASVQAGTEPLVVSVNSIKSTDDLPKQVSAERKDIQKKAKYLHGWRMGLALCTVTAGTVLMINLVFTVWAVSKHGLREGGIGIIQEGSCRETARLGLWFHLIINVLSTLLLGASNYCMQCLASPTREEVDTAHGQGVWLDIGVPSVRNLTRITRDRIVLWWILAISGIPLHLFYNSVVFSTLSYRDYNVYVASPELVSQKALNWSMPAQISFPERIWDGYGTLGYFRNISTWQQLDNEACIRAYAQSFVSAHGDLVAITAGVNSSTLVEYLDMGVQYPGPPYSWICQRSVPCEADYMLKHASNWTLSYRANHTTFPVQYCLSQPVEEHCQVQFSILIIGIVMACNVVKALCMLLALRQQKSRPLVTLGDAIEDFLVKPDRSTRLACLSGKNKFSGRRWRRVPSKWEEKGHRWFASLSTQRWLICYFLLTATLITAGVLLRMGLATYTLTDRSFSYLWQMGYGAVSYETMFMWNLKGSTGLHLNVLVANLPQMILSFLFLTYNGLFTCMLLADEWNGYAHERKPLRVTNPDSTQRSTYRLQLPYKYGVPLLIVSATLHWLVSQSLFLANVTDYDTGQGGLQGSISTIGYSCIAIITFIFLGAIVVFLGLFNGFRWHQGMPLAGSCSAAISAACHRPEDDVDAATKPVMWGVVSSENGVGHCCFTSFEVSRPVQGELYA